MKIAQDRTYQIIFSESEFVDLIAKHLDKAKYDLPVCPLSLGGITGYADGSTRVTLVLSPLEEEIPPKP